MTTKPRAKVYRADLYGLRKGKYDYLWENDVSTTEWEEVKPQTPFYVFSSQNANLLPEYQSATKVTDIFPANSTGVKTHRDHFAMEFSKDKLQERIHEFRDLSVENKDIKEKYKLKETRDWKLESNRKLLAENNDWMEDFTTCLYRPFDIRAYFHNSNVVEWTRNEVMKHFANKSNLGLGTTRSTEIGRGWEHIFCSSMIIQHHTVSLKETNYFFPLYLYPDESSNDLFSQPTPNPGGRRPNLSPDFIEDVATRLGLSFVDDGKGDLENTFGPEDIFHYIYAVFHSPIYRERYAEFLKIDFPRVPLTSNIDLFRSLVAKGETLTSLHLMERVGSVMTSYPVEGDNVVEKPSFKEDEGGLAGRVYINKTQYFDGVPVEVWNFYVGGYQVLHKWLKDRKGRELTFDDLRHYGFIVSALSETMGTMREINEAIEGAGGWPLG